MSARVSLVMCVYNQVALTRACLDSLWATTATFELVVIDNGSTDGTRELFEQFPYPFPLKYAAGDNRSVIAELNRGWRLASGDVVCFLHNDTEMIEPRWLTRLLGALETPGVGLAGLYGAKRVRSNGRLAGRTIVHSLAEGPTVRPPWEEVAFVDAVCLCLPRAALEAMGGLDEGYGFFHGIDRDLSFSVRERGLRCVIVHAPFHHRGGGTRTREFAVKPERERADLSDRDAALARFVAKWRHRLPADVRPLGQRVRDWLARVSG
jgi:glycosyltransferase involved in cell wall biosynthesis